MVVRVVGKVGVGDFPRRIEKFLEEVYDFPTQCHADIFLVGELLVSLFDAEKHGAKSTG